MAVHRSTTLPEGMIPVRISSLSKGVTQSPSRPMDTTFVTWPAPDGWYAPPRGPLNDEEEPFPSFQDPSKSLIIERTLLLDSLYFRLTALSRHARDYERSRFEALLSRVAESGHLRHDEDLSRTRLSIPEVLASGESYRAQRGLGNKGKLPANRRLKTNHRSSSIEPQPKDVLKEKMKQRYAKGVRQALVYEKKFGMGFLNQPVDAGERERGRTMKRTHPGAFNRVKVTTALTMLRQTFPHRYKANPLEQTNKDETSEQRKQSKKATPEKESQRELSSDKRASSSANDTEKPSGSPKSTDSFVSAKKKASTVFRGLVCKVGFGRFPNEKSTTQVLSPGNAHNNELDTTGACLLDVDSFPIVLKVNDMGRRQSEPSEPIGPGSASSRKRRNSAAKEFAIQAGIVVAKESGASSERAHPSALTWTETVTVQRSITKHSFRGVTGSTSVARATTARMFRPVSPPRMIQIKVRNNIHNHKRPQKSAMPKAEYPRFLGVCYTASRDTEVLRMAFFISISALMLSQGTLLAAQSVQNLGVSCIASSQECGPRGGIGDGAHPVLIPQSFITDALISTAPNTTRQLAPGPPPVRLSAYPSSSSSCPPRRNIMVDSANGAQQEMVGFGHAWTDSAVSVFNTLDNATLARVLEDLFGQSGNNMGFMRHTIGSSDLSGEQYTYDDNGSSFNEGEPDLDLSNFSLGPHGTGQAKFIAEMGTVKGDVFLFGSPWSYPGWTKYNDLFIAPNLNVDGGGSYNILNNSFNPVYIPQMVAYFSKYVDAFRDMGVQVNGITPMNEPLNYQGGYPCMFLDPVDAASLIAQGLGQAMHDRGVIIMAYDHNTDQPVYPARVIQGTGGEGSLTDAAAWHCYAGPVANYSVMSDFHSAFPNTLQFMTECSNYLPQSGSWNFEVASNFIPPVTHGASAAAMWVMATDQEYGPHSPYGGCAGCQGSVIVNSSTQYTLTNDYYMVGQFSRFVRRGSVNYRILGNGNEGDARQDNQFYTMAVRNPDSSWAVIMMNNIGSDQDVVLGFNNGESDVWQGTVPNATVVTWLLPPQGVGAAASAPAGPYTNGTASATEAVCPTVSASSSSSSSSSSTSTLELVPNTTHTIDSASPTSSHSTNDTNDGE
ncbi:uncharacterized protein PV07_01408 [Cladophialophora immunda]|uniref:Glycosyl hydrolase family 30 TIM-barrel domain-containing protein n=1 Tax=Cladophialophora immunda TaxID=569365 RepID=A0A0D2A2Y2_9EURO|nr:uncharacterized protein PV07_01408 [Cladophialophora immunda]KIW34641.1 hypothetical protein PV07_01408 [Cladophialophora immunda]